jgi:hypothetical protein
MGQSLQMRAPSHYRFVDLSDPAEAEYWVVVLDAPAWRIEQALAAVGRDAGDVRDFLQAATALSGGTLSSPSTLFQAK